MGRAGNIGAFLDRVERESGTPGGGILWWGYSNIKSLNIEVKLTRRKFCTWEYIIIVIIIIYHFQRKILEYVWTKVVRTTREYGLPTDHWTYKLGYKYDYPTRLRAVIFMRWFAEIDIQILLKITDCLGDFLVFSARVNVGKTGQATCCLLTSWLSIVTAKQRKGKTGVNVWTETCKHTRLHPLSHSF